jgi:hypothetical protein
MRLRCPKCDYYIDDELVPLIIELNKVGLKTRFSCSGHKGSYAYIMFDGSCIKSVEYGYSVRRYEREGKQCTIKWLIPKYARKTIRCSDCGTRLEEEDDIDA